MTAHILKHNMQTGTPSIETFISVDHLIAANAQHQGVPIKTKDDLKSIKTRYKGQGWVLTLLETIDPKQLED